MKYSFSNDWIKWIDENQNSNKNEIAKILLDNNFYYQLVSDTIYPTKRNLTPKWINWINENKDNLEKK